MIKDLLNELQKNADRKGGSLQQAFSDFVEDLYQMIKSNNIDYSKYSTYFELVYKYPFYDILADICVKIGRFDTKRGQYMTPFELAQCLNRMNQPEKKRNPEMLDFSCGTGIMGLVTLHKTYQDMFIGENIICPSSFRIEVKIHLNDLDNEMSKISTIQIYLNWLLHCSMVFKLDLLVTQNNVISDWEEPLRVIFQSEESVQNFKSMSKAKKNNLMLNPPFGLKNYGFEYAKKYNSQSRFKDGVPNKGDGEYAFILSAIDLLTDDGKAFLILPRGVQSKNSTRKFRKSMRFQKILDAVIAVPSKVFEETSIPTCVFMLNKDRSDAVKAQGVYMMNLDQAA